ncbi:MAG: exodeoxyribonuclease VII small subunit [Chloroflexi bacterium]|nr:exodeoxyribonuclease VII small subunit [Chloroflexota bacterium]
MSSDPRESPPPASHGAGSDPAPDEDGDTPSFEELYERLEQVAQALDAGGLPLDRSVALYEEGMRLAARCEALLDGVEQKIEMLRQARVEGPAAGPEPPADGRLL